MKLRTLFMGTMCILFTCTSLSYASDGARVRLPDESKIPDSKYFESRMALSKMNAAWQAFTTQNKSWEGFWNPLTQNPHRAWGEGIQVRGYTSVTESNAENVGWQFVRDYRDVLNANPDKLKLMQAENVLGKWYYKFKQVYKGLEVLNTFIDLRVGADANVFVFGSDFIPDIMVNSTPAFGKEAAMEFAKVGLDYKRGYGHIDGGKLYILPVKYDTKIDTRLVYNFSVAQSADEVWNTCVDAHTGEILWRYNAVHTFMHDNKNTHNANAKPASILKGKVTAEIFPLSYFFGLRSEVPLVHAYVNVNGVEVITNENGEFSLDIGSASNVPIIARVAGVYALAKRMDTSVTINNARIAFVASAGNDVNIKWTDVNSHMAERMVFYHLNVAHKFIRSIDTSSDLAAMDYQMNGRVNIASQCNASWSDQNKNVNFYAESPQCGNTAFIADVIYHEYAHGINYFYYTKRRGQDLANGALSEATADINANMIIDDPRIGIGFTKGGPNQGIIRNSDNNYHYPEDLFGEIHDDGMILTGAVWDMRKAIGLDVSRRITHFAKKGTPDATNHGEAFADYFIEILVADDDDNNLTNGTPNSAGIIPAFVRHGIPASGIVIAHNPLRDADGITPGGYKVSGSVTISAAIAPGKMWVESAKIIFSTDSWKSYSEKGLKFTTVTRFDDTLPQQKPGSIVRYYIDVVDNFGGYQRKPFKAPSQSYLFLVGYDSKVFDKFEVNLGWVVNPDGKDDATTGQWNLGVPKATSAQPIADHSPAVTDSLAWITGNIAGTSASANDVDKGKTTLLSPAYDLSSYRFPAIRYWRWYTNSLGEDKGTDEWVVQISNDDGKTWVDLERTKESILEWTARAFAIKEYVQPTNKVRVRFIASDYGAESLVEAAVDDFEILDLNANVNATEPLRIPDELTLYQNYPNPFNPSTTISYSLPKESFITLRVYNNLGIEVKTLVSSQQEPGLHSFTFDAKDLSTGLYMYELRSDGHQIVRRMMYVK